MDSKTWQSIRNGDAAAMRTLYQGCYQELYAFGFRMVADKDMVKDCLHEVFCEIWQRRESIGEVIHIRAYLKTCVRNKLLKEIKHEQRTNRITDDFEFPDQMQHSYEQLLIEAESNADAKIKLWKALGQLTQAQREIVRLKFFDELSYEAISVMLKLKTRTIYNHMHTAIGILRNALKN